MIGNVLPEFLSFSNHPFPTRSPTQPFPTLTETHDYLHAVAEPFVAQGKIRLNTEVTSVDELELGRGWKVSLKDWSDEGKGKVIEEVWDAVVVANGWSDNPVWPETEGLEALKEKGLAKHAKWWRGPSGYEGKVRLLTVDLTCSKQNPDILPKRLLVVGNANSSNDIAAQLAPVATTPVYRSIRRPAFPGFPSLPDIRILDVAPVAKYIINSTSEGSKVNVQLKDGTEISDVDQVLVGAGYKPFPDFIHVLGSSQEDKGKLLPLVSRTIEPYRIPSLHRHILYAYNPSLAFVGAPMAFTPFTVADASSTWLTLAWTGEIQYPNTVEGRLLFEKERLEAVEKGRSETENPSSLQVYMVLGYDEQAYAKGLKDDVVGAREELRTVLPEWNDERTKLRESMYPTKLESLLFARSQEERNLA